MTFIEFPKWLHTEGRPSVLVANADAEADLLAAWAVEAKAVPSLGADAAQPPIVSPSTNLGDWDHDGKAGGSVASTKPANPLTGQKRPGGWPKGKPRPGKNG